MGDALRALVQATLVHCKVLELLVQICYTHTSGAVCRAVGALVHAPLSVLTHVRAEPSRAEPSRTAPAADFFLLFVRPKTLRPDDEPSVAHGDDPDHPDPAERPHRMLGSVRCRVAASLLGCLL